MAVHPAGKMKNSRSVRVEFAQIDEETRALLRELRPTIARVLPGILDNFYAHVRHYPEVEKFFSDRSQMQRARNMQVKHWDAIAAASFDDNYMESVTRVGEVHHRLGLEPRWYIGGYSFILTGLLSALDGTQAPALHGAKGREKLTKLRAAITKAALLDMDLAISFYLEAGEREKQHTLEELSTSFQRSIGKVADEVLAAAAGLESVADVLSLTAGDTEERASTAAGGSEETFDNVRSVAEAAKNLNAAIHEINLQAQESSDVAADAVQQANAADARIQDLSGAAARIGEIVTIISDIARQTNLLALNRDY